MSDPRWQTCPQCKARNSQSADFCSQCFTSFIQKAPEPPVQPPVAASSAAGAPQTPQTAKEASGTPDSLQTQSDANSSPSQAQSAIPDHELTDTEISLLLANAKAEKPAEKKDGGKIADLANSMISSPVLNPSAVSISNKSPIKVQPVFQSNRPSGDGPNHYHSKDGEMLWTCGTCESTYPIDTIVCIACGRGIAQEVAKPIEHDASYYVKRELMFPGLGIIAINNSTYGYSRMIIVIIWLLVAASLMFAQRGIYMALPLFIGSALIWISGPHDVRETIAGRPIFLSGSRFLYFVIGVFLASFLVGGLIVAVLK